MCTACGPSFLCSAGACTVDPASRWNVVLEHLEVSTTATTGAAWDVGGGAPDPVVRIVVGSETAAPFSSGSASDVFAVDYVGGPTATDQRADALQGYLGFFVFDEDLTDYEFIGGCTVTLAPAVFSGSPVTTECPRDVSSMQSGYSLSWHLERF